VSRREGYCLKGPGSLNKRGGINDISRTKGEKGFKDKKLDGKVGKKKS